MMTSALADAFSDVKAAFGHYPKPTDVGYCPCCFTEEGMARLFAVPYHDLTEENLSRVLFKSFTTWGDWPDLAYFVPRLLELSLEGKCETDMLHHKLVGAAHGETDIGKFVQRGMPEQERKTLARFFGLWFEEDLARNVGYPILDENLPAALCFLSSLDAPIVPILERWKISESMIAQANLMNLMAEFILNDCVRIPVIRSTYFTSKEMRSENRPALDTLLAPEFIASYLVNHMAALGLLTDGQRQQVDLVFDWAASQMP